MKILLEKVILEGPNFLEASLKTMKTGLYIYVKSQKVFWGKQVHVGTEASPTFTLSNFDRTALMETCCTEHARNEKFHYIVCKAHYSINVRLMSSHVPKFLWIRKKSLVHSLCMLSSNKSLNFFQTKIPTTDHVDDDEGSQLLYSLQKSFKHLSINAIWHTIDTFEVH